MSLPAGRLAVLAASLALMAPAGAHAAAPWSAPVDLGPGYDAIASPTLAFAPNGNGLAGWVVHTSPPGGGVPVTYRGDNDGNAGRVVRLTQGDGLGALRALPDTLLAG